MCPDKLIMGHLSIKSIRNKFDALSLIVKTNVDILMICETKLADLLPTVQFSFLKKKNPSKIEKLP